MLTFLKTAAAVLALFSLIPLFVWLGSGSWRQAREATRDFLLIMGGLAVAGAGTGLLMHLLQAIG